MDEKLAVGGHAIHKMNKVVPSVSFQLFKPMCTRYRFRAFSNVSLSLLSFDALFTQSIEKHFHYFRQLTSFLSVFV